MKLCSFVSIFSFLFFIESCKTLENDSMQTDVRSSDLKCSYNNKGEYFLASTLRSRIAKGDYSSTTQNEFNSLYSKHLRIE